MAIPAPTIVACLRNGGRVKDDDIDEGTLFSIGCNGIDNSLLQIYFTINGSKPNPNDRSPDRATLIYKDPFTLTKGKYQFKAMAERKGNRGGSMSSTASKWYDVQEQEKKQQRSSFDPYFGSPLRDTTNEVSDEDSTGETWFNPEEYLETRKRYKDKKKLEEFGDLCELCKTPRATPATLVCAMCGYKLPDATSREVMLAREMARNLTLSPTKHATTTGDYDDGPVFLSGHVDLMRTKRLDDEDSQSSIEENSPSIGNQHKLQSTTANTTANNTANTGPLTQLLHSMNHKHTINENTPYPTSATNTMSKSLDVDPDTTQRIAHILSASHEGQLPTILKREAETHFQQINLRQRVGKQTSTLPFKWCDDCKKPTLAHLDACATCFSPLHTVPLMQPPDSIKDPRAHNTTTNKNKNQKETSDPNETSVFKGPNGVAVCTNCDTECAEACRFCYWCGYQFEWEVEEPNNHKKSGKNRFQKGHKNHRNNNNNNNNTNNNNDDDDDDDDDDASVHYITLPDGELVKIEREDDNKYEPDGTPAAMWKINEASLKKAAKVQKKFKNSKTQTEILYFRQLEERKTREDLAKSKREKSKPAYRERSVVVADVSPGNGYWRQQLDHVLMKLKAFARNSPPIQLAAGQYRMGDVTGAQIRQDGDQVLVTISLDDMGMKSTSSTRDNIKSQVVDNVVYSARQRLQGTQTTQEDFKQVDRQNRTKANARDIAAVTKATVNDLTKLLFDELGVDGGGDSQVVLGLIDEGANVHAFGVHGSKERDRDRPLHVAARYGRAEAIKFLLTAGAKVNDRGSKGDTPLHSVVRGRDNEAMACISILIENGADAEIQNVETLTPCALAAELGLKNLVNFFGKSLSNSTLSSLSKSRIK